MRRKSLPPSDSAERIAPLAKLPVFWSLTDRRVVVAGGSDAAAWKAELLAACGARVEVFCEPHDVSETMQALIAEGKVCFKPQPWSISVFEGASLALGDCEGEDEARAFTCAARAAGVPYNVIDKPAFCQFQFGSIVNRSPVIVSISTDGAAPILAQAIRQRIETLLPPALKDWAALARQLREAVNLRLAPGQPRRKFWESFVDRCMGANRLPADNEAEDLLAVAERIAASPPAGRVTLVGAGPGDAELLTLKAMRALQAADVILFDEGVSRDVLELARREAKRFLVGDTGGRQNGRDEAIETVARFAREGKRVVRLMPGDPLQARGTGTDIARLERQGLSVVVIAGISAHGPATASLGQPDAAVFASAAALPAVRPAAG